MKNVIEEKLSLLSNTSLLRQLREIGSANSRAIILNGKCVLNFSSNDYLGLANDERLIRASQEAMDVWGVGSGASRLVSGNQLPHLELEKAIAQFKSTQGALFFTSGYMANTGIISALMDRHSIIFSDKLNHASIIDGILLSRGEHQRYHHRDMAHLRSLLEKANPLSHKLIVTDSVFSMDGDKAPLKELVDLAKKFKAVLMVDEAHGVGVLGPQGAGLVEEVYGNKIPQWTSFIGRDSLIQMGTLSKAAGCFGAYVAGSSVLINYLINHARSLIYTTALPASMAAVGIIRQDKSRREKLLKNATYLRTKIQQLGFDTLDSTTAIIPVVLKDAAKTLKVSKVLLDKGIFVQAIRPPTVPVNTARLRVTVMAIHTQEDLDKLIKGLKNI